MFFYYKSFLDHSEEDAVVSCPRCSIEFEFPFAFCAILKKSSIRCSSCRAEHLVYLVWAKNTLSQLWAEVANNLDT